MAGGRSAEAGATLPNDALPDAGRDASPPPGDGGLRSPVDSHDGFCEQIAKHACLVRMRCCGAADLDLALCTRYQRFADGRPYQASCWPGQPEPDSFDSASAETCAELTPQSYDGCRAHRIDTAVQQQREQTCERVAPLPQPGPNETCTSGDLCRSPPGEFSECLQASDGARPFCSEPQPRPGEGEACGLGYPCLEGLVCIPNTASGRPSVCATPRPDGAACLADVECASGACATEAGSGRCAAERPELDAETCADVHGLARYGLYAERVSLPYLAGDRLIWIGDRHFHRAPKDGSGPVVTYPLPASALIVGHDATHWLALDGARPAMLRFDLERGDSERIELPFAPGDLAGDATHLYAASKDCSALARIAKDDLSIAQSHAPAPPSPLAGIAPAAWLAFDGDGVYCASRNALFRYPAGGGGAELLAALGPAHSGFFVQRMEVGPNRIWLGAGTLDGRGELLQIDKAGGSLMPSADPIGVVGGGRFAHDGDHWLVGSAQGIVITSLTDGSSEVLPVDPIASPSFAMDDEDHYYWIHQAAILRIAK
jgi:hypothetical protein